jgi:hypothetical protein
MSIKLPPFCKGRLCKYYVTLGSTPFCTVNRARQSNSVIPLSVMKQENCHYQEPEGLSDKEKKRQNVMASETYWKIVEAAKKRAKDALAYDGNPKYVDMVVDQLADDLLDEDESNWETYTEANIDEIIREVQHEKQMDSAFQKMNREDDGDAVDDDPVDDDDDDGEKDDSSYGDGPDEDEEEEPYEDSDV